MIVTPAQAGVQFKPAWIPACGGMTKRYYASLLRKILYNISGTQRWNDLHFRRLPVCYGSCRLR
jgi:hypothetical protein